MDNPVVDLKDLKAPMGRSQSPSANSNASSTGQKGRKSLEKQFFLRLCSMLLPQHFYGY